MNRHPPSGLATRGPHWFRFLIVTVFGLACAAAQADDGPELYLSLQGVAEATVEQGEPLRVAVLIEAPDNDAGPWLLAPATGTWTDAVAVEILTGEQGKAVVRGTAVGKPEQATATLDDELVAGGLWRFAPELIQKLAPGAYRLRATLEIADGVGWRGSARSDELTLTVLAPSGDPARAGLKTLALARDALLLGQPETAAKLLDEELQRDLMQFRVLLLRATIAEQAGNPLAAQWLLNGAQLSLPEQLGGYPNLDFEALQARVLAALLNPASDTPPPEPPAWSWPPDTVLRALWERMTADLPEEQAPAGEAAANSETAGVEPAEAAPSTVIAAAETNPAPAAQPKVMADPSSDGEPGNGPRFWVGDQAVPATSNGQWAVSARAGSEYGPVQNSAAQATGAPNVPGTDDNPNAWCPAVRDSGSDWLELTFEHAVPATEVRVRQSYGPGAIVKVEAIDTGGQSHLWWEGLDPYGQEGSAQDGVWFVVRVPATSYAVQKIRLTLDLGLHGHWKQIDAVQLVGE